MPSSCCAPGCTNRLSQKGGVKMFRFPSSNKDKYDRWIKKINRLPMSGQKTSRSDGLWEPKDHDRVCNAHFISGKPNRDPKHPDYVPSVFKKILPPRTKRSKKYVVCRTRDMSTDTADDDIDLLLECESIISDTEERHIVDELPSSFIKMQYPIDLINSRLDKVSSEEDDETAASCSVDGKGRNRNGELDLMNLARIRNGELDLMEKPKQQDGVLRCEISETSLLMHDYAFRRTSKEEAAIKEETLRTIASLHNYALSEGCVIEEDIQQVFKENTHSERLSTLKNIPAVRHGPPNFARLIQLPAVSDDPSFVGSDAMPPSDDLPATRDIGVLIKPLPFKDANASQDSGSPICCLNDSTKVLQIPKQKGGNLVPNQLCALGEQSTDATSGQSEPINNALATGVARQQSESQTKSCSEFTVLLRKKKKQESGGQPELEILEIQSKFDSKEVEYGSSIPKICQQRLQKCVDQKSDSNIVAGKGDTDHFGTETDILRQNSKKYDHEAFLDKTKIETPAQNLIKTEIDEHDLNRSDSTAIAQNLIKLEIDEHDLNRSDSTAISQNLIKLEIDEHDLARSDSTDPAQNLIKTEIDEHDLHRSDSTAPAVLNSPIQTSSLNHEPLEMLCDEISDTDSMASLKSDSEVTNPEDCTHLTKEKRQLANAFLIFSKHHRHLAQVMNLSLDNGMVTKLLGEWWNALPPENKQKFYDLANEVSPNIACELPFGALIDMKAKYEYVSQKFIQLKEITEKLVHVIFSDLSDNDWEKTGNAIDSAYIDFAGKTSRLNAIYKFLQKKTKEINYVDVQMIKCHFKQIYKRCKVLIKELEEINEALQTLNTAKFPKSRVHRLNQFQQAVQNLKSAEGLKSPYMKAAVSLAKSLPTSQNSNTAKFFKFTTVKLVGEQNLSTAKFQKFPTVRMEDLQNLNTTCTKVPKSPVVRLEDVQNLNTAKVPKSPVVTLDESKQRSQNLTPVVKLKRLEDTKQLGKSTDSPKEKFKKSKNVKHSETSSQSSPTQKRSECFRPTSIKSLDHVFNNSEKNAKHLTEGGNDFNSVKRKKSVFIARRCGQCQNCLSIKEDCGICKYCKDKRKFGGPNRLKQRCRQHWCLKKAVEHTEKPERLDLSEKARRSAHLVRTRTGHSEDPTTSDQSAETRSDQPVQLRKSERLKIKLLRYRMKEIREKNIDRKKRSDELRKRFKEEHKKWKGQQKKSEHLLKNSAGIQKSGISEQTLQEKDLENSDNLKNEKLKSPKVMMKQIIQFDDMKNQLEDYRPKKTVIRKERAKKKCYKCKACMRQSNCGKCDFCRDMACFGGMGLLKQKCRLRQCKELGLYTAKWIRLCAPSVPKEEDCSRDGYRIQKDNKQETKKKSSRQTCYSMFANNQRPKLLAEEPDLDQKQRTAYTAKQKLAVIEFAEKHGNRAAEREFDIRECNIRYWRKTKDQLKKQPESKKANRSSSARFPELEEKLLSYVTNKRHDGGGKLTARELRIEAKRIAEQEEITSFGGSMNWVYKFARRHSVSFGSQTQTTQKVCEENKDPKPRTAYTAKRKLAAIQFAEKHGNRAAERKFDIDEGNIRYWRKMKDHLKKQPESKKADRFSLALYPELEVQLLSYVADKKQYGDKITITELRREAKRLAEQQEISSFSASVGWGYAFARRHSVSIGSRTRTTQKVCEEEKDFGTLSKRIGEKWQELSQREKSVWRRKALKYKKQQNNTDSVKVPRIKVQRQQTLKLEQKPDFSTVNQRTGQKWKEHSPSDQMESEEDREPVFEIEMVNDARHVESEISDISLDNSSKPVNNPPVYSVKVSYSAADNSGETSLQTENRNLGSHDSFGECALSSGNIKHKSERCVFPKRIKTEPLEEQDINHSSICDREATNTRSDILEMRQSYISEACNSNEKSGAHRFENEWLKQQNIVIKQEPEDDSFEVGNRTSLTDRHRSLFQSSSTSDSNMLEANNSALYTDSSSDQIPLELQNSLLQSRVEIKSEN